ncbi:MAG: hypothetical protein ACI9NQ_000850 [Paracoccaceae bacterium]|jgi:hypothetical protein
MEEHGSIVSREEGTKNCIEGFKKMAALAEKHKVTLVLEPLNSRVAEAMKGHPGYQGDHIDACVEIVKAVSSPSFKVLFDAYHVQIMDGDLIRRIEQHHEFIGHVQIAGNPGRGEIGDNQEINYRGLMKALLKVNYPGYVEEHGKRYAALKCLDAAVGLIANAIAQSGFTDNTLLIFANDNGGLRDEMNAPYRGTKSTNYEGGVRVPCLMRWPKKLAPKSSNDALMHVTDLYSTFATLAGASLKQERELDGKNMTDVLFADAKSPRNEIIFEVSGSVRLPAIRKGKYKLVGKELYNLEVDPSEKNNIAEKHPEIAKELSSRVAEVGRQRPPLTGMDRLMSPALPWVYGQQENKNVPEWLKQEVQKIRKTQPKEWAPGTTPWPQAPKDGKIIYTGDGR